ncbi:serine-rich coiled-coil domain-containing protein 2 isoform 2-T2 [Leptodactylus fuscus]|uniref:serine-rich coiled-coil domain-containing protein 2 isoform X2 n=1 Tax=Leptodactylus fuscus TaxID=238119 RepID=UPI003F4EAD41
MEEKLQIRASLGSKLPKFGGPKSSGSFIQRAPNGTHSTLLTKSNYVGEKHSDHDRTSGFSLNWKKLKCQQNGQISRELPNAVPDKRFPQYQIAVEKDPEKSGKQTNMLLSQKEDLNENLLSTSNKFSKGTPFGRAPYSGLNGCKTQVNGFYTSKPPTGLYRPRANSATSRNFPSKALSTESKSFSNVRRSQSFSHSVQNSLLPNAPLTRSHSFNREVDPTRPYQSQHLPIQTALRQNTLTRTVKQYGLSNGNDPPMKSSFTRTYPLGSSLGVKKPGLANGPTASVPLGYRMSRPSLQKTNRLQLTRENICRDSKGPTAAPALDKLEPNGTCQTTSRLSKDVEEDLEVDNCSSCENLDKENCKDSYYSEDVDELSISSLSSSDKNDFSEDFSDDFIDLEDGNKIVMDVESEKKVSEKPSENLLAELQDEKQTNIRHSDEWIGVNISVQSEAETSSGPHGENRISPDMDYRDPSSLELSPSDSSDGTYMWDEEGMEPIGNVHPCGSYDSSEMNSLDILNNLDSCDLEDDDLMLDVDLPEDPTCDMGKVENMSHFERTDRSLRQQQQAFWKRAPPRLNGQEQYHLSNPDHYHNGRGTSYLESPTDHRESYGSPNFYPLSPRSSQMTGFRDNTVILDEMTLCHMVQDCTTVKTQLLKLKRLLQQDDSESTLQEVQQSVPTTPEPQDTDPLLKTEELLKEIQQLKEESKKKDETIKHLQQQLKTPCMCQKESQDSKVVKPKQHDKYTQTTWRRSSPQVLQRSISTPSTTDHTSGKLIAHPLAELQSITKDNIYHPVSYCQTGDTGTLSEVPEKELSDLLSTRLKIDDVADNPKNVKVGDLKSHERFDDNKNVTQEEVLDVVASISAGTKKDVKLKVNVNSVAASSGEIPKSKTLHLPRPKIHNALAQKGVTNSSIPSSKDPQMWDLASSPSLTQASNDSQSVVQKVQSSVHSDHSLHQRPKQAIPNSALSNLDSLCPAVHSKSRMTMPDTKPLSHNSSPSVSNGNVSSEVALPTETQVPTAETSKPTSKLMPKGSMLRPPSKLKKPNSSKLDVLSEPQKSPVKGSPTAVTKPPSNKKESLHENVESLVPKRQSRLPQPKAH